MQLNITILQLLVKYAHAIRNFKEASDLYETIPSMQFKLRLNDAECEISFYEDVLFDCLDKNQIVARDLEDMRDA